MGAGIGKSGERARMFEHAQHVFFFYIDQRLDEKLVLVCQHQVQNRLDRAGAALAIAGLVAEGTTVLDGMEVVQRGYQDLPADLQLLGADISTELLVERVDSVTVAP